MCGDRDRLMQVLVNLLSNAVKFTPEGDGLVEITIDETEAAYRLSVADNGPGIALTDQRNIFDKFRQGSGGTQKPVGTGLGLPISRRIVEHLGGRIWVESQPPNGATFTFEIPKKSADAQGVGENDDQESPDRG